MKIAGVSDATVEEKTGKSWQAWLQILDEQGAANMSHTEIAKLLRDELGVSPWWAQKITGGYEQARTGRKKHEMPGGFEISRTRTWPFPLERIYTAWVQDARRQQWLPERVSDLRETSPGRSLWMAWAEGKSRVNVRLDDRGAGKTTITVDHTKLADEDEAKQLKALWGDRLDALHDLLSGEG